MSSGKRVILTILDGFGIRDSKDFNAVKTAKTPNIDRLLANSPSCQLSASGLDVGLPKGQMGNSEVGHTNIGAGRIVYQDLTKIDKSIDDGDFFRNEVLLEVAEKLKKSGGRLHLMGLVSPGGVHSSMDHIKALLDFGKRAGLKVTLHCFLDGRDTPPKSALEYVGELEDKLESEKIGTIGTVTGRFYAMDRDNRWERVEKAYDALISGIGLTAKCGREAVEQAYSRGETDEFVLPTVILDEKGEPKGLVSDGDAVVFFNFRADRAREISMAVNFDDFTGFERKKRVNLVVYATMTRYRADFPFKVLFEHEELKNILGEVVSNAGKTQLRIAETEKYAHVTFFFNGGKETVFDGEERILVPSPKVQTYDLKPEMSACEVTDRLLENIEKFDLVILNFANPDMVGHTGVMEAAVKAIEAVDECVGRIMKKVEEEGRVMVLTADHGNSEQMFNEETHAPHTAHTTNPVPFAVYNYDRKVTLKNGVLADIAPTILKIMELPVPKEMSGKELFE
ncbi:2,3-bisphosphoglycerate-independent phosphoglycerate mutase [bacterium]|nr:2,3-bisphosphoglycerate-independent phosphoglycerate mutase [bacterium]